MNILLEFLKIDKSDPVAITFFTGYMAMFASSIFFFFERTTVDAKWKTSLLVSALITGIAAVHYYYMRDYYINTHETPTALRYIDWSLTVPLMCVEFYLLLKPAGASKGLMWRLIIAGAFMLVTGYIGEAFSNGDALQVNLWGAISTIGYVYILYTAMAGEAKKLADASNNPAVQKAIRALGLFVLIGWGIYPIGYMAMPGGLLSSVIDPKNLDLIYNLGDAVNKIGFGFVVYSLAITESAKSKVAHA
jgi:sensory rhodopsin